MKRVGIKVLAIMLVLAMVFSVLPGMAATVDAGCNQQIFIRDRFTSGEAGFLRKLPEMLNDFELNADGSLRLRTTIHALTQRHNLTDTEVKWVIDMLSFSLPQNPDVYKGYFPINGITPDIQVRGTVIYFTNAQVWALLFDAARWGPKAIIAKLAALGAIKGGPIGAVLGKVLGLFSGGQIAYTILQAAWLGQGFYIGIHWNGPFPIPAMGTW